jgi:LmbE family N-acetylglucosaminyl deacetylase
MPGSLKLLAVFPHPDDETLGCGSVLARYAAEGVQVHLVCATRGQQGWFGPAHENPGPEALGEIREAELLCAADKLGLHAVEVLDYQDGQIAQADRAEITAQITTAIRRIQPQVVITYGLEGVYGHPDHIALAQITAGALVCAADGGYADPEHLPPYRVLKYYASVNTHRLVERYSTEVGPISILVDGVNRMHVGWEEWAITTRLDTRAFFEPVWRAILCHRSQHAGFSKLLGLPRETLQDLLAEATLVRNYSLVHSNLVETDLFEGLRTPPR